MFYISVEDCNRLVEELDDLFEGIVSTNHIEAVSRAVSKNWKDYTPNKFNYNLWKHLTKKVIMDDLINKVNEIEEKDISEMYDWDWEMF